MKNKKLSLCPFPLGCPHSSNQHNAEKWACAPLRAHIGIYQFGHQRRRRPDLVAALIWCTQVWRSARRRDVKRYLWGGALAAVHYLSQRERRKVRGFIVSWYCVFRPGSWKEFHFVRLLTSKVSFRRRASTSPPVVKAGETIKKYVAVCFRK